MAQQQQQNRDGVLVAQTQWLQLMAQLWEREHADTPDGEKKNLLNEIRNTTEEVLRETESKKNIQQLRETCVTVTKLPEFGQQTQLPNIRDYRMETHRGNDPRRRGTRATFEWLDAIVGVVVEHNLSEAATKRLMVRHAAGQAARFIRDSIKTGEPMQALVACFERVYGELIPAREAKKKLGLMARDKYQPIGEFAYELLNVAQMATREEQDPDEKAEQLARGYLIASVDDISRQHVKLLDVERSTKGCAALTFNELIEVLSERESESGTLKNSYQRREQTPAPPMRSAHVAEEGYPEGRDHYDQRPVSPNYGYQDQPNYLEEVEIRRGEREYREHPGGIPRYPDHRREQARRIGHEGRRSRQQWTRPATPTNQTRSDVYRSESPPPPAHRSPGRTNEGTGEKEYRTLYVPNPTNTAVTEYQVLQSSYDRPGFISFQELGVSREECMKCGQKGHFAGGKTGHLCVLRDETLEKVPCSRCKKGGHRPEVCPNIHWSQAAQGN